MQELQQDRVREVGPARQMTVPRAAVRVGRVWQARERALEVEEKDAVPLSFEAGETRLHGPAPLRVVGADVAGLRVFDRREAEEHRALFVASHAVGELPRQHARRLLVELGTGGDRPPLDLL